MAEIGSDLIPLIGHLSGLQHLTANLLPTVQVPENPHYIYFLMHLQNETKKSNEEIEDPTTLFFRDSTMWNRTVLGYLSPLMCLLDGVESGP